MRREIIALFLCVAIVTPRPLFAQQAEPPAETDPPSPEPETPTPVEAPAPEQTPETPAETAPEQTPEEEPVEESLEEEPMIGVGGEETTITEDEEEPRFGATASLSPEDVFRAGGSIATIDPATLARLRYDDPTSVVLRVPGVTVRNEDGFGLRPNIGIRGTNPERSRGITLMEDGVLFGPAPYSAPAAYFFPLIGRMASVDVFKGPAAIQFGPQTVGGAIDFRTRDIPVDPAGAVDFAYGSYGSRRLHLHYGLSGQRAGFLVEAMDLGSLGFKDIDRSHQDTGFSRTEIVLRGFVQSLVTRHVYHRLELKLSYGRERSNETYLGITDADFAAQPDRRYIASAEDVMRTQRYAYELTHRLEVGTHLRLLTTIYRHDYNRRWHRFDRFGAGGPSVLAVLADPNVGANRVFYDILTGAEDSDPSLSSNHILLANNNRTFVSQGVQSTLRYETETGDVRHQLLVGARLHYDRIDRDHTAEGYIVQNGRLVHDGSELVQTSYERASALALALHAAYALEYGRLRVTPGMRTEIIRTMLNDHLISERTTSRQHVVLGGFGANVRLMDWLGVFAGMHRGFGPVAPGQDASVKPELSLDTELGLRVRHEDLGIQAELSGFVNHYTNMLLVCTGAGGCSAEDIDKQFNAGEAIVGGLEASFSETVSLPNGYSLPLRVTYAYTRSRFQNTFTSADPQYQDVHPGDEVPYLPRHQGTLGAGVEHARFRINVTASFVSRLREQAGHGDQGFFTDRQAILDAMGDVAVHDRVRLTLRCENLTNARPLVAHRPLGARPYRPLTLMAGVHVDL